MRGYKVYNYHPYFLGSSGALSPHVSMNIVGGFDP